MLDIWSVITNFQAIPPITEPVNLELFWDRWLAVKGLSGVLQTIFANRSISYAIDGYEGDNTILTTKMYTAGFPQIHTLYANGDEDFIRFTATSSSHTITTSNLINGADTFLSLYGPSQTLLRTNDNTVSPAPNPPTTQQLYRREFSILLFP